MFFCVYLFKFVLIFLKHGEVDFLGDLDQFISLVHLLEVFVIILDDFASHGETVFLLLVDEEAELGDGRTVLLQKCIDPVDLVGLSTRMHE
jgi:hypothetical protein